MDLQPIRAEAVGENKEDGKSKMDIEEANLSNRNVNPKKTKKKKKFSLIPKFGCMRLDDEVSTDAYGSFNVEADSEARDRSPTHLIVMVNGIIGSAQDWRYAAKKFVKAYPSDVIVHCSESNSSTLTFDGVDVMGKRLADEVISVVGRHPYLQKISFLGHSLGGLIARYAVAVLYHEDSIRKSGEEMEENCRNDSQSSPLEEKPKANICGLEPVNFITFATPHFGSRGHKQVPVFCGSYAVEQIASRASGLLGRTGKHLFLTDYENGKPPLLLRMSCDSEDLKFISALQSFNRRAAYANTRFDHLVGWSSASLRRRNELPKRGNLRKNDKYPHIWELVAEDKSNSENLQVAVSSEARIIRRRRTHDMEETMVTGLTRLHWERVDVNFSRSIQRLLAHNTIQVNTYCINSHGADVIQHLIDNFQL